MRKFAALVCASMIIALPVAATDVFDDAATATWNNTPAAPGDPWQRPLVELFNNGPWFNSVGTGAGGADESILETALGMNTLGAGHQYALGYQVLDDFTLAADALVTDITTFSYQTGSPTAPSTITGKYIMVHDGVPGAGGNLVWGDYTTNLLTNSTWSNVYRVTDTNTGVTTNRPIYADECDVSGAAPPLNLTAGTYFMAWSTDGSGASGPWVPPIVILGQTSTGDAYQSLDAGATFDPLTDSGLLTPLGLPFILEGGGGPTPTEDVSWGSIKDAFQD